MVSSKTTSPLTEAAQGLNSDDQFYASLPRDQQKSLLCCVCSETNTTFRYEVIYNNNLVENKDLNLVQQQVTLTTSIDTSVAENDYYNFPPRHPRHGHLKWPILRPLVTTSSSVPTEQSFESICITTYPDYPVHLPTFTLKRVLKNGAKGRKKGNIKPPHNYYWLDALFSYSASPCPTLGWMEFFGLSCRFDISQFKVIKSKNDFT